MKGRLVHLALVAALLGMASCAGNCGTGEGDSPEGPAAATAPTGDPANGVAASPPGRSASLVEEVSIGVEVGEEPYMLGIVWGVAADEERIYVLDSQAPALRVYDSEGTYLTTFGGEGDGPGEYRRPDGLSLGPDGRVYVRVFRQQRINVYDRDGNVVETLNEGPRFMQRGPLRALGNGVVYTRVRDGYIGLSEDGRSIGSIPYPEYERAPLVVRTPGNEWLVPFSPWAHVELTPAGALVAGFSDEYRFTVTSLDGRRIVLGRDVEPVPVLEAEREWHQARFLEQLGDERPEEGEIPEVPDHKPFFSGFVATHDGHVWVIRPGPGELSEDCEEFRRRGMPDEVSTCWRDSTFVDASEFDSGQFVGEISLPDGFLTSVAPHIEGDRVVGVVLDEAGTYRVKRYRLVWSETG